MEAEGRPVLPREAGLVEDMTMNDADGMLDEIFNSLATVLSEKAVLTDGGRDVFFTAKVEIGSEVALLETELSG